VPARKGVRTGNASAMIHPQGFECCLPGMGYTPCRGSAMVHPQGFKMVPAWNGVHTESESAIFHPQGFGMVTCGNGVHTEKTGAEFFPVDLRPWYAPHCAPRAQCEVIILVYPDITGSLVVYIGSGKMRANYLDLPRHHGQTCRLYRLEQNAGQLS
jgi:hypothetical protein